MAGLDSVALACKMAATAPDITCYVQGSNSWCREKKQHQLCLFHFPESKVLNEVRNFHRVLCSQSLITRILGDENKEANLDWQQSPISKL